ncbi:MAG: 3'-5' exonuclease [Anaerolineae bacterium]
MSVYEAYSDQEEAEYVISLIEDQRKRQGLDYKDFAVMYRTNAQSRSLEDACIREGVPYKLVGGIGFYKRREVRDLLAYLRLVNNFDDSVSFGRVINVPKRGIGKKSVDDFQAWAARKHYTNGQALEALADGEVSSLNTSAVKKIIEFYHHLLAWQELAQSNDLGALLDEIIARIGYTLHLHETSDTTDEALERDENVRELRGLLNEKKGIPLNEFLEEISLVADVDTLSEDMNAVTLLTLHAAKGLEYPIVFLTGLEEGILPHMRSFDEPDGMAEERRLFYVGITRAMQRVFLTYAFRRMMYGDSSPGIPSRFLADIPATLTEGMSPKLLQRRDTQSYLQDTIWERPEPTDQQRGIRGQIAPYNDAPATPKRALTSTTDNLQYRSGQKVRHAKFGDGIVIQSKRSGSDEEVTVSFKTAGLKTLAASFAKLTILDG